MAKASQKRKPKLDIKTGPANMDERGLVCRKCGCRHLLTIRTVPVSGDRVRRDKRCRNCGHTFKTTEGYLSG